MKRSKPLRRKTPLRARGKTSYRRRPRDLDVMRRVRKLPCIVRACAESSPGGIRFTTCRGRVQADHAGERAFGRKAPDDTTIPLCTKHHRERTDYTGMFKGMTADTMRAWCDWAIAMTKQDLKKIEDALTRYR